MISKISLAEVEEIAFVLAKKIMEWDEPLPPFTTRFLGKLESCLDQPFLSFDGKQLYPTLVDKAAILFYLMNKNHPFENGNKRLAVTTLLVFLFKNDLWLDTGVDSLYKFAKSVAASAANEKEQTIISIKAFISNAITKQ
ncbi:MAG: type II toxin-antitoxin system death-on-curing family toxin [bacterium]|nr:type II toxin-antitoxin system death-on-curing family toxin [bacterium]